MRVTFNEEASETSSLRCFPVSKCLLGLGLFRVWRILATGFAFITFMAASFVMALVIFPLVKIQPSPVEAKGQRIRRLIQISFKIFLKTFTALKLMRPPKVIGLGSLKGAIPCIIVANHPTLIDAVLLGSLVGDFNCVVKHSLRDHFFLGGPVRAAGYVTNDKAAEVIRLCCEGFQRGQPLVIFPEGSRSVESGIRPFSRGAAQLALRSGMPLIPAVITCDPPTLMKHQRWYDVPECPVQLSITFHPPLICQESDLPSEPLPRKARRFTCQIENFFRRELNPDSVQERSG